MANRYGWQDYYEAAILETDREQMTKRILEAKTAIDVRLREMQANHGGTLDERQAISDAIAGLYTLSREAS
jgi:hypothetical protein